MKIAIPASGNKPESKIDARFGRAEYFMIYDSESDAFNAKQNSKKDGAGGVGVSVSQMLADEGVNIIISRNFGPKSQQTLSASGIEMYTTEGGTVEKALADYKENKLRKVD